MKKDNSNKLLPGFKNNLKPVLPPLQQRFTKEELQTIIEENYGVVTVLCGILDCTYAQFYKAIDKYNLRECLANAKKNLVGLAEKAILDCLKSQNENIKLKASEITLKSLGKTEGWSFDTTQINQQINVVDKNADIKTIFGIQ